MVNIGFFYVASEAVSIFNLERPTTVFVPLPSLKRLFLNRRTIITLSIFVILSAIAATIVLAAISIPAASTYVQDFNTIGTSATASLPADFKVDKFVSSVRTVGTYASAGTATERAGTTLTSSAGNGIYNFGASANSADRAVGFLASGSGTASGNLYAQLVNSTGTNLNGLQISYNVEKYRNGSNTAGFSIQLYYSTDGASWTSAGSGFLTSFPGDADNNGFASAPGATVGVINNLNVSIPTGTNLYLAWNYSVTSGTTVSSAQALGIDDINITGIGGGASTKPIGVGAANPSTVTAGNQTLLTVTVTPGTSPTSTGITVTGNLTAIGGSATQTFFDDGTNGDVTAGDNIFSYLATVPSNNATGNKSIPITVSDAEARTSSTSISLTIQAPPVALLIHDIQGSVETPQQIGNNVIITGIVVGDFQGTSGLGGFFVEEESSDWDANDATSEGIFVFQSGGNPAVDVALGDSVTVTGVVSNFPNNTAGLTELTANAISINTTGNTLPPAAAVALPVATSQATDLERFEGMRIAFNQTLYATNLDDLGSFGEVEVSANSPLYIPTNTIDPNDNPPSGTSITGSTNVAAVTAQQSLNNRSKLIIDDGSSKTGSSGTLTPLPYLLPSGTLRRGDFVTNPAGVLTYISGAGSYALEPTPTITFTEGNPRPAAPAVVAGSNVRIASANVENYFLTVDPTPGYRGPNTTTELNRKRAKVVAELAGLNADVIGLVELEKAGGNAAAADLAAGLTALGTVGTYAAVADLPTLNGTDPDIKNGMIYRTSTVSLVGSSFTDNAAAVGAYSRDPLAQTFKLNSTGVGFTVIVNHFRSKGCGGGNPGDADLGDGQSCFNDRRRNQAQAVVSFVNSLSSYNSHILVVGDLNAYAEEDPIDVFRAAGMTDVVSQYVAPASKYSFTFNGEAGQLDHAFATSTLAAMSTGLSFWHINADEPDIFDYNTENKPDDHYTPTPYRAADHDPLIASFNLAAPTAAETEISGQVTTPDGAPLAGAVVRLDGAKSAVTITNNAGYYTFENLDAGQFYTLTPGMANYTFSPASLSFSLMASRTDAIFTASQDQVATATPIDTNLFFIRQQYLDFLGREPDQGGLLYWTNELEKCGSDKACLNRRRNAVSAAFFMSDEFEKTGSFVYRIYKASYGSRPIYAQFTGDRQKVVGGAGLEAMKTAFAEEWVQRAEFRQVYPDSMLPAEFVNTLMDKAGLAATAPERQQQIQAMQNGRTRAEVIREIIEMPAFKTSEYNASFVLMQYFGYLKRDPDEGGYQFWLNVLNNKEPGNFKGMVCSFITSEEYQKRFSTFIAHSNRECGQ